MPDKGLSMNSDTPAAPVPELVTDRTLMRGHRLSDFQASANMWADLQVVRHITGSPSSGAESWSRLLRHIGHWHALGFGYWVVEDRQTGEFLGEVGFADYRREIAPPLTGPEIGWVMAVPAHGKGLASEAVAAAVHWGDDNLGAQKTTCIIAPEHGASIRIAEKMGYSETLRTTFMAQPTIVLERTRLLRPQD